MYERSDGTRFNLEHLGLVDFFSVYNVHESDVRKFMKRYNVSLVEVVDHCEKQSEPPMIELYYIFSDNLGGYTIDAIRKSLDEVVEDGA